MIDGGGGGRYEKTVAMKGDLPSNGPSVYIDMAVARSAGAKRSPMHAPPMETGAPPPSPAVDED